LIHSEEGQEEEENEEGENTKDACSGLLQA
jgi:hypothetical protein